MAERKVGESEAELAKRSQDEQAAKEELKRSEKTAAEQQKLATLGFYRGEASGQLDGTTVSAMNAFQKVFGQAETQTITPAFLNELNNTNVVEPSPTNRSKTSANVTSSTRITPAPNQEPAQDINQEPTKELTSAATPTTTLEASLTVPSTQAGIQPVQRADVEPELTPELIVEAKKIKSEAARYPGVAERRGHDENATIIVSYDVDAQGKVINPVVKEATGTGRFTKAFEKAAITAAEKAEFSPRTVDGKTVVSTGHETRFTFNIE